MVMQNNTTKKHLNKTNMKQTAVEWVFNQMSNAATGYVTELNYQEILDKAKEVEKEQMIKFHKWMIENDTAQNAEKHFHFTDSDMLHEYYNETFKKD